MDTSSIFFTTLFLIISSASMILGIRILSLGKGEPANRMFFVVSLLLAIWGFGFATAALAADAQTCLLWRRVAAFGWSGMFACALHFALAFTGKGLLVRKPWFLVLLYLPAALNVWVFSVYGPMAAGQYNLVKEGALWVNIQVSNGWDWFYYAYVAGYTLLTLVLLARMWMRAHGADARRNAGMLLVSYGAAILLGSITDLINSALRLLPIPQLAPVAFMIPLIAIYYSLRRYRLLRSPDTDETEIILNDRMRGQMLRVFTLCPILGGIVLFITQYLISGRPLQPVLVVSVGLELVGLAVFLVQILDKKHRYMEILFELITITLIPVVVLSFLQDGGVTVWAAPLAILSVATLFNNRQLLITTGITTLLTILLVSASNPSRTVVIGIDDHIMRFVIAGLCLGFGLFVNKSYVSRLRMTASKNRMQRLVSDVSKLLLAMTEEDREESFQLVLQQIARGFDVDYVFLHVQDHKKEDHVEQYLWSADGQVEGATVEQALGPAAIQTLKLRPMLRGGRGPAVGGALQLPAGLEALGVRSAVSVPLDAAECFSGFLGLGARTSRSWGSDELDVLHILINILCDTMGKLCAERETQFMAHYDHLTQLPNRMMFTDRANQAILMAQRTGKIVGVVFLDLDSFKSVNDSLGHRMGDELIREVANKLTETVRKSDTVSRFGGDEFLLLIQNASDPADCTRVMDSIMRLFERPFHPQGQEIFVTASAGVAIYPQDGDTTEMLIKNADIAMYAAKDKGKNQYLYCSAGMKQETQRKAELTRHLYHALERGEMQVYYQPQMDLRTNRIIGAEALLRWKHPQFGMVPPCDFIPLAEHTGAINAIGEWVLREACRQLKSWHDMGLPRIRVAVNISVNQLRNPMFVEQVYGILARTDLAAEFLELEVTESVATREPAYIVDLLNRLKIVGVLLSIDDFGTEYSSLSRLKELPVDRIKMDMQYVQGIDKNEKDRAISKVIITLAKSLGLKVVAEGVESPEQLEYLNQKMCDEMQGFLCHRPVPADEMESILREEMDSPAPHYGSLGFVI